MQKSVVWHNDAFIPHNIIVTASMTSCIHLESEVGLHESVLSSSRALHVRYAPGLADKALRHQLITSRTIADITPLSTPIHVECLWLRLCILYNNLASSAL